MSDRKQITEAQMQQMLDQVDGMAKNAGLNYNFETMKLTDTFPAHRVFQFAKEHGKGYEYFNKLYQAFFMDGELISDSNVIKRIAGELGLDENRVDEILSNDKEYDKEVVLDIYESSQIGIQGVPFFVFNNKYGVSGAQPVEVFEQVLTQVYDEFAGNSEA